MRKSLKKRSGNHSLLTNLLVAILIIFTIAMYLLTSFSVRRIKVDNDYHYETNLQTITEILESNINKYLSTMDSNVMALTLDYNLLSLKQLYQASDTNTSGYVKLNSYLVEYIVRLENLLGDMISGAIYTYEDNIFYSYTHVLKSDVDVSKFNRFERTSPFTFQYPIMPNPFFKSNEMVIPIVYNINPQKNESLIYLLSVDKIAHLFWSCYEGVFDDMEIQDMNGNVIYESLNGIDYSQVENLAMIQVGKRNYSVKQSVYDSLQWRVYLAKDNTAMLLRIRNMKVSLFAILLTMLVLAYIAIVKIYSTFRRPFDQLYNLMEKNSRSFNYTHFEYPKNNEIGRLGNIYNEMIDEIESLFLQLEDKIALLKEEKKMTEYEQEQKRLAEIKALQAQINPHFLYNALNSIVWMAEDSGDEKVLEMTIRLADFYKTGLSKGSDAIALKTEVEHAYNYLCIQNQRYDKIKYSFSVDKTLEDLIVPKLILQPLIENAIYHGIKPMREEGEINVIVKSSEDVLFLIVENTGVLLSDEKMQVLNSNLRYGIIDSESGYGIYNVNNRIRLTYGVEWGLRIDCDGQYTRATVRLPLMRGTVEK